MARDKGVTVPLHQLLVYPVTAAPSDNASYKANADAKPLDKPMMEWFVKHASSDPARDGANPYFAPLTHGDAKGLPPTTIITAEIDPLRTEGMEYARKLKDAGVKVKSKDYEGVSHEFFGMAAVVPDAKKAQDFAAGELKAAFAKKR